MMKVLQPRMPHPHLLIPYLERMHSARHYSNNGKLCQELAQRVAEIVGVPCVPVANATQGLELALKALGIGDGHHVAVPAATFAASGLAIRNVGAIPVLTDVDPENWILTPKIATGLSRTIKIDAVMPVAAFGLPVLVGEWAEFADRFQVPVVIDAAGALTTQRMGKHKNVHAVYSLHATKFIGAGEGGIFASSDASMIQRVSALSAFRDIVGGGRPTNAKLSEYHAAVALASLDCRTTKHRDTQRLDAQYLDLPAGYVTQSRRVMDRTLFPVLAPKGVDALALGSWLHENDIETKQWYRPFLHECLDRFLHFDDLPVTQMLIDRLIGLPFHLHLQPGDPAKVIAALRSYPG